MTVDDLAQEIRRIDGSHRINTGALVEALMPFVSKYAAQAAPVQEPTRPDILEKLSYHALERDDLTLDDCLSYLRTSGWHKVRGRTERELVLQITELLAAAPKHSSPARL